MVNGPHTADDGQGLPRETLEGVRRRDPAALEALFELCFDRIYGLAYRMLGGNTAAAEDTVQEVFLRIHRSADRLDPDRDPVSWVLTITANLCRDHHRSFAAKVSRAGKPADDEASPASRLVNGGPSPEASVLADEREQAVQRAIDRLPDQLREVVLLRDYQGLEHAVIAEMLETTSAAVRKRYSRALAQLGEMLEGIWP